MDKNKGAIGVGLIVAIVLGIAVVGGGVYYLGTNKSEDKKNVENPIIENDNEEEKINTTSEVASDCNSNSIPSITVLSPNGGEVYKAGDKITVKWESCNFRNTKNDSFIIGLKNLNTGKEEIVNSVRYPEDKLSFVSNIYYKHYGSVDSDSLYLPNRKGNYKIFVCAAQIGSYGFTSIADTPDCSISDYSDNYFVYKTDSRYAVIKSIYKKENKYYIDVSYYEIITGEEAYTAQTREGWCDKKEECISDYYQKNLNKNGTLEIDPNVDITVLTYLGSDVDSQYKKLDKFVDYVAPGKSCSSCLFSLKIEDNKVISIGQFIGN